MKPFDFIAVKLTLFLVLGIFLGHILEPPPLWASGIALICICLLGWMAFSKSHNPLLFVISAVLTTMITGMLLYTQSLHPNQPRHYSQHDYTTTGVWQLKILEVDKENQYYQGYVAKAVQLDGKSVSGKIRLQLNTSEKRQASRFDIDDMLLVWGKAGEISFAKNIYQWDFSTYLRKQNIYHQIQAGPDRVFALEGSAHSLKGWAGGIRNQLIAHLEQLGFGQKELSIIKALLLGERGDIAPGTLKQYQRAGAMHILAISGLHIGMILLILRFLFQPLSRFPRGRQLSLLLAVITLWTYALITGFSPSVIRATAMFSFLAYTLFLKRISQGYNTLALSMFFLLVVVDPLLIFQVGFQMSYAAVMAILWVYPILRQFWKPRSWFLRRVWQLIIVSLSAQLGVLPISLYYFHQFPGLFLLSSLVIVPVLGLILGGGILVTALSLLDTLPRAAAEVYNLLIAQMNGFVEWIARQEAFYFEALPFDEIDVLLVYAFLISLVILINKPSFIKLRNALCLLILFQVWGLFNVYQTRQTTRVLIMHQYNNSVLLYQNGSRLSLHATHPQSADRILRDFQLGARIKELDYNQLQNRYEIAGRPLVRPDKRGTPFPSEANSWIWLSQSPRINLDRYIAYHQPAMIIADGSNPNYLLRRWEQSCMANNVPFHYTGEEGTFVIDF